MGDFSICAITELLIALASHSIIRIFAYPNIHMTKTPHLPDMFAALADPTRLRIVHLLLSEQELCVCDLQSVLDIPQPTVSRHLALLRNSGIVVARRADQWMHYSISENSPLTSDLRSALVRLCADDPHLSADVKRLRAMLKRGSCAVRPATNGKQGVRAKG